MTRKPKWASTPPEAIDLDTDPELRQFWKELDQAQRDFLLANGCWEAQGYLYSRPVPAERLTEHLRQQSGN